MWYYTGVLFKQYLKSPYTYASFLFPFILIIGLGKLVPAAIIIPSSITIGITITILFLFGGSIQEIRRTSLIKSMSLTRLSKLVIFSVNIFVATAFAIVITIFIMIFSFGIYQTGYLAVDFSNFLNADPNPLVLLNFDIDWSEIQWLTFIYAILLTVGLTYSITFLIISFTKTTNALYIISILYFLVILILGGVILPVVLGMFVDSPVQSIYKFIPHYYTNQLMSSAMASNNSYLAQFLESDFVQSISQYLNIPLIKQDFSTLGDYMLSLQSTQDVTQAGLDSLNFQSGLLQFLSTSGSVTDVDIKPVILAVVESQFGSALASVVNTAIATSTISGDIDNSLLLFLLNPTVRDIDLNLSLLIDTRPPYSAVIPDFHQEITTTVAFFDLDIILDSASGTITGDIIATGTMDVELSSSLALYIDLVLENLDGLNQVFENTEAWNFHNLDSMLNSFLPPILIIVFGGLGIRYFKWSIR